MTENIHKYPYGRFKTDLPTGERDFQTEKTFRSTPNTLLLKSITKGVEISYSLSKRKIKCEIIRNFPCGRPCQNFHKVWILNANSSKI